MVIKLAGLASCAYVGRSTSNSMEGVLGKVGKMPLVPPGVTRGVEVLRGVTVGLRSGVGEGVQVGSIRLRGVGLGVTGVGVSGVGDGVGVVAQLASIRVMPRIRKLILFMIYLPSGFVSALRSFSIQQVAFGRNRLG